MALVQSIANPSTSAECDVGVQNTQHFIAAPKPLKTKQTPDYLQVLPEALLIRRMVKYIDHRVHKCFPRVCMFPWESDVLVVSKAGLIWEIEIKRTLADLKADAKKSKWTHPSFQKISRFSYLVPVSLQAQALEIIPAWAGLYVYDPMRENKWNPGVSKVREPKQLGRYKIQSKQIAGLMTSVYHRFWDSWKA